MQSIIPFEVEVSWTGGQPVRKLTYDTVIEGANEHHITVVSPYDLTGVCVFGDIFSFLALCRYS